jgi:hypothetical protein
VNVSGRLVIGAPARSRTALRARRWRRTTTADEGRPADGNRGFLLAYATLTALAVASIAALAAHLTASGTTSPPAAGAPAGRLAATAPARRLEARDLTLPATTFAATGFTLDRSMTGATTLEMVIDRDARARMQAAGRVDGWRVTYRDERTGRPLKALTSGAAVYASDAGAADVIARAPVPPGLIEQPPLDTFYDRTRLFVSPDVGRGRVVVVVWQDRHAVLSVTLIGDRRMEVPFAFVVAGQAAAWTHPRALSLSGDPVA